MAKLFQTGFLHLKKTTPLLTWTITERLCKNRITTPANWQIHNSLILREPYNLGAKFVLKSNKKRELEKLYRACRCGSADSVLLHTPRHPTLLKVFQDLLMSDTFEHLICQLHAKMYDDNVAFSPHRDADFRVRRDPEWQDINQWGSYVVAIIAIDNAGPSNGGIYLAPNSHNNIDLTNLKSAREHFDPQWKVSAICPELKAGDALFIHPYLVQWSCADTGNKPRFSLL